MSIVRQAGRAAAAAALAVLLAGMGACRGLPPKPPHESLTALVDSLRPLVERAAGLRFKGPTPAAIRTRDEVRQYIASEMEKQLPPSRARGTELGYALLGLFPDTLSLASVTRELLASQILGYYDPKTRTFYGVAGADPALLAPTVAHELVHALQDQYLPLDSIMRDTAGDRHLAAHAILEGQATYVASVMARGRSAANDAEFWEQFGELSRSKEALGELAGAPLILREGLLFPYRDGAAFMAWWYRSRYKDTLPYGPRMPASTEQILHPDRYADGDRPIPLGFTSGPRPLLEDEFGEIGIRILADQLAGLGQSPDGPPLGWGGDRFRVYEASPSGAVVWYTVWDDARAAERFRNTTGKRFEQLHRPGYRIAVDPVALGDKQGVRLVIAPESWQYWRNLPAADVLSAAGH
jgi:hypothetical protein